MNINDGKAMRLLFLIDTKDYDPNGVRYIRPSARCITIRNGKIAMVYSRMYDYYKFPGGGIENNETLEEAVIRETKEEVGLKVIPESVRPYGYVRRLQKSDLSGVELFEQDNFYFLCDTEDETLAQDLDDYESKEEFTLKWITPEEAIQTNLTGNHGPKNSKMLEREAKVLKCLTEEGYIK